MFVCCYTFLGIDRDSTHLVHDIFGHIKAIFEDLVPGWIVQPLLGRRLEGAVTNGIEADLTPATEKNEAELMAGTDLNETEPTPVTEENKAELTLAT